MKIEFDLPKFEKEISINIVIRKDGEVVETFSESSASPTPDNDMESFVAGLQKAVESKGAGSVTKQNTMPEKPVQPNKGSAMTGNFMDASLF